jgi:hypothetical protein
MRFPIIITMHEDKFVSLKDSTGSLAVIAPELGGWLLRYARPTAKHGLVDALHFSQAVVDRYPKEMWAGNPLLFPMVSFRAASIITRGAGASFRSDNTALPGGRRGAW